MHIISRVKSENEKGYYIVDAINEAINVGVKISFYYSELNGKKKEVLRNDVKLYTVSPFDLIWDGDYYYLTGYCDEREFVHTTVVTEQGHVNRFICREHTGDLCRIFRYVISLRLLNSLLSQSI